MSTHIHWHIYEIYTPTEPIHGVRMRGRLRKLGIEQGFNILCENASDKENCVRFALLGNEGLSGVKDYVHGIIADATIEVIEQHVINPVLSKLVVNKIERYDI